MFTIQFACESLGEALCCIFRSRDHALNAKASPVCTCHYTANPQPQFIIFTPVMRRLPPPTSEPRPLSILGILSFSTLGRRQHLAPKQLQCLQRCHYLHLRFCRHRGPRREHTQRAHLEPVAQARKEGGAHSQNKDGARYARGSEGDLSALRDIRLCHVSGPRSFAPKSRLSCTCAGTDSFLATHFALQVFDVRAAMPVSVT